MAAHPDYHLVSGTDLVALGSKLAQDVVFQVLTPQSQTLPLQPQGVTLLLFPSPSLPCGTTHRLGTSSPCTEPGRPCLG